MEWTWVADNFRAWAGKGIGELTLEDVAVLAERWERSVVALDRMLYDDARKEYSLSSTTGFGADGEAVTRAEDFRNVRGEFEEDAFVRMVQKHSADKSALGADLRRRLGL